MSRAAVSILALAIYMAMRRYIPECTPNACAARGFAKYTRIHVRYISMYAVLINSSAGNNSRQLIGDDKDADGYGAVALIFALKWALQETRG